MAMAMDLDLCGYLPNMVRVRVRVRIKVRVRRKRKNNPERRHYKVLNIAHPRSHFRDWTLDFRL